MVFVWSKQFGEYVFLTTTFILTLKHTLHTLLLFQITMQNKIGMPTANQG